MLARIRPALAAVSVAALGVVAVLAGCAAEEPDTTDVDRIAVMRSDGIYAHLVGDPDAEEGAEDGATFLANSFAAPVDPWAGENTPVGPTVAQRKGAVAALVGTLRTGGWQIISARCHAAGEEADPGETQLLSTSGYQWEVFGYRVRDSVPYAVHLVASYAETSGFSVRVTMMTPFHADPAAYFSAAPPALAEGGTCVEAVEDPDATAEQGTIWTLDAAKS